MQQDELLQIRGLSKSHANRPVLRGINLDVHPGEVLGLVGENGAGKSTLMSILAGTYAADAGSIELNGEPYRPLNPQQAREIGVGIIEQGFRLDPNLTVAQALYRHTYQADRPHEQLRRPATWALNEAGVHVDPDALIGSLLRPEIGLVEAVRLLIDEAQLVIVDEVAATFNVKEIEDLHFITSRLTRQGRSVIYISHRLHEVQAVSDRVAVLREGYISTVVDAAKVTADDIATAVFGRQLEDVQRHVHVTDEEVLTVSDLTSDALKGVSFSLHRGEILGLLGGRGDGVSDVVGALTGDRPAHGGHIELNGQRRQIQRPEDAAALRITYFSDDDDALGVSRDQTIARNLMASGWDESLDFDAEVEALRSIIETISTLNVRTKSIRGGVDSLSGGDQQKIALARFISEDSDLMILNEPTRGLDVASRREVLGMLAELTNAGKSAILICTDLTDLKDWTDRIVVLNDGVVSTTLHTADTDLDTLQEHLRGTPVLNTEG